MFRVSQATEGSFLHRSVISFWVSHRSLWWSMGVGRLNFQWLCGFQLNPDSCVRWSHLTKPEVERFTGSPDADHLLPDLPYGPKTQRRKRGQFDEVDQLPQRPHLLHGVLKERWCFRLWRWNVEVTYLLLPSLLFLWGCKLVIVDEESYSSIALYCSTIFFFEIDGRFRAMHHDVSIWYFRTGDWKFHVRVAGDDTGRKPPWKEASVGQACNGLLEVSFCGLRSSL